MNLMKENPLKRYFVYCFMLTFAFPVLVGCAATGPKYSEMQGRIVAPKEGQARLYFMRETTFSGSAMTGQVHITGEDIKQLSNGGFLIVDVNAGTTSLKVDSGDYGNVGEWVSTISTKPGEQRYFLVAPNMNRNWDRALIAFLADTMPEDAPFNVSEVDEVVANSVLPKLALSE